MEAWQAEGSHGSATGGYVRLVPERLSDGALLALVADAKWQALAESMIAEPDAPKDGPDAEENLRVPAGYTYLGQFVAHDLSFEAGTSLRPSGDVRDAALPENDRTARFDLDSVYGMGPVAQPYLYDVRQDGSYKGRLLLEAPEAPGRVADLARSRPADPRAARAVIGDPRNDENSILCQLHVAFVQFHNAVVDRLEARGDSAPLFEAARAEVRWTYQRMLVEDFLPRLVRDDVLATFEHRRAPDASGRSTNDMAYRLFKHPRTLLPLEFALAAFRFGHSMVRNGYRLNSDLMLPLFAADGGDDLVGFEPLADTHAIEWKRFFPDATREGHGVPRPGESATPAMRGAEPLQYAYRIDASLADPLAHLPPRIAAARGPLLSARTLEKGRRLELPSGQLVASMLGVPELPLDQLGVVRIRNGAATFERVDPAFGRRTPLWFYVLAEAQAPVVEWLSERGGSASEDDLKAHADRLGTRLGWVGGMILLETFHGLLDADRESYRHQSRWQPLIRDFRMWDLVNRNFR